MNKSTSAAVARRYNDAYRVAREVIGFGKGVKAIGLLVAFVIAILGFLAGKNVGIGVAVAGAILGVFMGALINVIGVLIVALGQTQYATLDVAVNTSPILEMEAKAGILAGLPVDSRASSAEQPFETTLAVLPRAIAGLDSTDPAIRENSVVQLGELGAEAAVALAKLELLRSDPVGRVRGRVAWAVEEINRKQRLAMRPKA